MWIYISLSKIMSKSPENLDKKQGKNNSTKLRKIGRRIKDVLYTAFTPTHIEGFWYTYMKDWKLWINGLTEAKYYEFMLCSDNYLWARIKDKWRLLDKQWREMIYEGTTDPFEVDEVKLMGEYISSDLFFPDSISEWRIFCIGSEWWVVADNWTIVFGNYTNMHLRVKSDGDYERIVAIWTEILENWEERPKEISTEDWSVSEFNPSDREDHDNEKKLSKNTEKWKGSREKLGKIIKKTKDGLRDEFYNRFLKIRFTLEINWKEGEFISYMKDWKVWIKWVLDPEYEELEPYSKKYVWMREWNTRRLMDLEGNVLHEPTFEDGDENMYKINCMLDDSEGKED